MRCLTELSELQSVLPNKCLTIAGEKLNIIFMCVVPILRFTVHIRNSVSSEV